MNFLSVRLNRCARCPIPCPLQGDRAALAVPEAVCGLGLWQTLPVGISGGVRRELVPVATGVPKPEVWGPAKWAELHTWALKSARVMPDERRAWLANFAATLPQCACKSHWRGLMAEMPAPVVLGTSDDMFAWSVDAHNAVNRMKGKPEISCEEALKRWGTAAPTKLA